jgi:signal transduction histidine kinase
MKRTRRFNTRSPILWGVVGCCLALLIGVIDYWTMPEAMLFYMLPVLLAARYGGLRSGMLVSFVSALIWLGVDIWQDTAYAHPLLPLWNLAGRMALFTLFAVTVTRMVAAQRQKDELTEFIVHDLRSPLTSIMMGLQTIHVLASERNDDLEIELAESGLIGSNRLLALINSLLDTGRLANGRMPLQLAALQPDPVLEAAVQQVELWANQTSISIDITCDAGEQEIVADAALTERVLVNLLGNAIKFSPAFSTVTLRVSPFQNNKLAFSVTDEGRGMTDEEAQKVFRKYAQIGVKEKAMAGSGIGLTFCRMAIEAQNGHIWIESAPGQGTTVTFTLPATGTLKQMTQPSLRHPIQS